MTIDFLLDRLWWYTSFSKLKGIITQKPDRATLICCLCSDRKAATGRYILLLLTLFYFIHVLCSKQIGVLAFLNGGEEGKALYNAFVCGEVCYEVYKRLTVSQADVLRVCFT